MQVLELNRPTRRTKPKNLVTVFDFVITRGIEDQLCVTAGFKWWKQHS